MSFGEFAQQFASVIQAFLVVFIVVAIIALVGLLLLARRIRNLRVPHDADFFTTMRLVPLSLVVLLDLLDLGLDVFSAPLMWVILDRMGLPSLRNKAAVEALIPFSGPIPTFTLAWIAARTLNLGHPAARYVEHYAHQRQSADPARKGSRINVIDMDDYR